MKIMKNYRMSWVDPLYQSEEFIVIKADTEEEAIKILYDGIGLYYMQSMCDIKVCVV